MDSFPVHWIQKLWPCGKLLAVARELTGSVTVFVVCGRGGVGLKGNGGAAAAKGLFKSQWSTAGKTNNAFHLASFSHLAHILSLLFFLSICPLPPLFTHFAHSLFLPLCGKFNGFLGSEWDILSLWTIITRVRATSCNSLTPSPTGYNWMFCLCVRACMPHLKSAWSVKTRYSRLVKPSGWPARLLSSKSAYLVLIKQPTWTSAHTPLQRNGKSLQRGTDLLLLVLSKIKSGNVSNES